MGYFGNSSEGEPFEEDCATCPLGEYPCPIAGVQLEFNYVSCNNKIGRDILNRFITQGSKGEYIGCQMKRFVVEIAGPQFATLVFPEMKEKP